MENINSPVVTRRGAQKAKIQTRAMLKSVEQRQPSAALLEAKRKAKLIKMQEQSQQETVVKDIFQNAVDSINFVQGYTGIIYDESMSQHHCLWDVNHPERPERFTRILDRCKSLGLIDRCQRLPSRCATKEEILLRHTEEHFNLLQSTAHKTDDVQLEELSSRYDSVYLHPATFDLSLLATGCTIDLVDNIVNGNIQNGMAIIRPPGHHAMKAEINGYCFFNNVAIAAQYALDSLKLKRILIIDWDIHHGQGTQRFFYNDPRVLYFSIHRFEHGTFWPNLKESDFDALGEGPGLGYNFNLPLNKPGMTNSDYLAIFQQILVPVALEYQPEIIIVSAGYDAALGCPEGEMEVTPAFYPHLLSPLLKLAQSRIAVILEGGYCLDSLSEGAALTLRTLLGDPCPLLAEELVPPCESVQDSILNCIFVHRSYWKCLQVHSTYTVEELNNVNPQPNLHKVCRLFVGGPPPPDRFPTRDCFPIQSPETIQRLETRLRFLKSETNLSFAPVRVCYVYDDMMLEHQNMFENGHPEQPKRIKNIYEMHFDYGLLKRMEKINSRHATTDEICLAHTRAHLNSMRRTAEKEAEELAAIGERYNSVYFHHKTFDCATLAAGSVLQVVDSVLTGQARSGICIVRPPGHHAESDLPHGFCIFNNIAIAAQYAIRDHGLKRVFIIDWDVHHGNGTQHIFESNPNVLYISVHRYDNASFFPKSPDANFNIIGKGDGEGFNVNIPWNKKGMGDAEYMLAFQQLIMPIAYEFNPELVLVSAGFDAAIGDPLGGCKVTPEAYGLFTHWLSALANGRIIVCLEGGYNVNSISYAMTMCTKSLLGDPLPPINPPTVATKSTVAYTSCIETLQCCLAVQQHYWKHLKFHKKLPQYQDGENNNNEDFLSATFKNLNITFDDVQGAAGGSICRAPIPPPPLRQGTENDKQPGPSKPTEKVKTLTDFVVENLEALQNEKMFAVVPLKTCPHLSELRPQDAPKTIDTTAPCIECSSIIENWMCLICFKTLCGRYVMEHMLYHNIESSHSLALSYSDLSVWCYSCESYVDNRKLHVYKNLSHRHKFGIDMIWLYDDVADDDDEEVGSDYMILKTK